LDWTAVGGAAGKAVRDGGSSVDTSNSRFSEELEKSDSHKSTLGASNCFCADADVDGTGSKCEPLDPF